MTEAAMGLETDSEYLRGRCKYRHILHLVGWRFGRGGGANWELRVDAELKKYTKQVDEIDERVGDLEKLVKELDEWCGELGECT